MIAECVLSHDQHVWCTYHSMRSSHCSIVDQHVWCTYHSMRLSHCSIIVCVLTVRVVFMHFVYKNHFNLKDACPYVRVHTVILLQLYGQ